MIVAVGINYDVMENFKYNGNYFWTMWGVSSSLLSRVVILELLGTWGSVKCIFD